mmetsp:Transcript_24505/g.49492  ORF Transcript_24505/g.49492 Transcript_24505/m.49492 type:complete len:365 (+) Transcript_24505:412-1506(+)
MFLDDGDKFFETRSRSLSNIEYFIGIRTVDRPHDSIDNIIDVRIIARRRSIPKLLKLQSPTNPIDELEWRHVRSTSRSIHGEEPQSRHIQLIQMMVRIRQKLARLLARGIGTHGVVYTLFLGEEGALAPSIHAARTGKDKVLDAEPVTQFHEMGRSPNIGMNVHEGILNRGTNSGPRGHVANPLRAFLLEQLEHELFVTNVSAVDGETLFVGTEGAQEAEVVFLDADVVVVVHFVDNDDVVSAGEEVGRDGGANEARSSGDEDFLVAHVRFEDGFVGGAGVGVGGGVVVVVIVGEIAEADGGFGVGGAGAAHVGGVLGGVGGARFGAGIFVEGGEGRHTFGVCELHDWNSNINVIREFVKSVYA